jgi:hypothetical protein
LIEYRCLDPAVLIMTVVQFLQRPELPDVRPPITFSLLFACTHTTSIPRR